MMLEINLYKKTAVILDSKELLVKKFYFKNYKFKSEIKGYLWYFKRLNLKKKISFFKKKKIFFLHLPLFKGYQVKFWKSITKNKKEIALVLQHYKKIWPRNTTMKVPYHGDLTFSNIIFNNENNLRFIDWENFKKKEIWGLDICYFLLSTLILPALSRKNKIIFEEEYIVFREFWSSFFLNYNFSYLNNPINFLKKKNVSKNFFLKKISKKNINDINNFL